MSNSFVVTLLFLLMTSCAIYPSKSKLSSNINYSNISYKFKSFWNQAKGRPLFERFDLWDKEIENKYSKLYSLTAWSSWSEESSVFNKKLELWATFEFYEKNSLIIMRNSSKIEKELNKAIHTYLRSYPDSKIYGSIFVLPLGSQKASASIYLFEDNSKDASVLLLNSDMLSVNIDQIQNILINKITHFDYLVNMKHKLNNNVRDLSFERLFLISGLGEFNVKKFVKIKTNYSQNPMTLSLHKKIKKELSKYSIDIKSLPPLTNYACTTNFVGQENLPSFNCSLIPQSSLQFVEFLMNNHAYKEIINLEEKRIENLILEFIKKYPKYNNLKPMTGLYNK